MLAKKLSRQQMIGKRGASLFTERTLAAGLSFHETGALDTGIDGFLEMRDPNTGEVKAQYISAQIKTQETGSLHEEKDASFSFPCAQKDLDYWLGSNLPVIMVVVHLETGSIWWKSVQDWFSDDARRRSRKIVFDKDSDRLTQESASRLTSLVATFARPGLMVPSNRVQESLITNLLRVKLPTRVHVASCELTPAQATQRLGESGRPPRDWIISGQRIWSFSDLASPPYRDVIEEGTEEWIATGDWSRSDGDNTRRDLVQLLRRTLWEMVGDQLGFSHDRRCFYFRKREDKDRRIFSYQSFEKRTSRAVVAAYPKDKTPIYYRHAAFRADFLDIEDEWFMAVEPTYYFSKDGFHEYRRSADRLSGIKRLESNQTVRGQVAMWSALLVREGDMLRADALTFQDIGVGRIDFGVPDDLWRSNEEDDEKQRIGQAQHELDI